MLRLLEARQDGVAVRVCPETASHSGAEKRSRIGGLLQERADCLRLLAHDLGRQVIDDVVVLAVEPS